MDEMTTMRQTAASPHDFAQKSLEVTFARTPDKHVSWGRYGPRKGSAYAHDVFVEGVRIGQLVKDYEEGHISARGCVGGSMPGAWVWEFVPVDELVDCAFFMNVCIRGTLREAKDWMVRMMQPPLNHLDADQDWMIERANGFCTWLETHMEAPK